MKRAITICLFIVTTFTLTSLAKSELPLNDYPPIQSFLEKFTKVMYGGDLMVISQKVSSQSFVYKTDWKGIQTEETYSEINWDHFELYTKIVDEQYVSCEFRFSKDITYNYIDDEQIEESNEVNSFTCFILLEDKEEFLKIVRDWKNTRH
ncbi:MAG: hypothetical protein OQJ83_07340 [Altibacter sp.]|uniref:hypothetical protein n=1 Tax=Altibacter lentus TaxID=1223410 RepID=UPI00055747A6|nr:hypothetical protein [Altibacter lentus]MCW8981185.1 hypothetical protein [Altibacter sp.]